PSESLPRWIDQYARGIGMTAQEVAGRDTLQAAGVEHDTRLGDEVDEVIAAAILDGFDAAGNPALPVPIEDEIVGPDRHRAAGADVALAQAAQRDARAADHCRIAVDARDVELE